TYLSWPYLWNDPINHFIESLTTMSKHSIVFHTLFMGDIYLNNQLPFFYFPVLLGLQLTIPILILISVGLLFSFKAFVNGADKEPTILFVIWFLDRKSVV